MTTRDLAGILAVPCYERIATGLHLGINRCEQEGRPLTELQQIDLWTSAVQCADGLKDEIRTTMAFDGLMDQMRAKPGGDE